MTNPSTNIKIMAAIIYIHNKHASVTRGFLHVRTGCHVIKALQCARPGIQTSM